MERRCSGGDVGWLARGRRRLMIMNMIILSIWILTLEIHSASERAL